jgi:hypothetical protein
MNKILAVIALAAVSILLICQPALARPEMGVRASLGVVPGVDKFEATGTGGWSVDVDSETGGNLNVAFVIRTTPEKPIGFVGVVGPFVRGHAGSTSAGNDYELAVFGITAQPGIAVNLSKKAHLEFKGELGFGAANQSIPGATDGSGPYVSLGFSTGVYFKLGKTFVLGGDVGYSSFTSTGELNVAGTLYDIEFTGSGPVANISVGWMF